MRHIALTRHNPDPAWVKEADRLLELLKAASGKDDRIAIIKKYKTHWGKLKPWLLELSHGKCWFTEAKDCASHFEVEHFRPKKDAGHVNGPKDDGYWWLAYDWRNYRICGNVVNRMKSTYFPLRPGCKRATPHGDLRYEEPVLLDPADEDDPNLLFFNVEGRPIPAPHVKDKWELARVEYSIERCKLDFPPPNGQAQDRLERLLASDPTISCRAGELSS